MKKHIHNTRSVFFLSKKLTLRIPVTGLDIYAWSQLSEYLPTLLYKDTLK